MNDELGDDTADAKMGFYDRCLCGAIKLDGQMVCINPKCLLLPVSCLACGVTFMGDRSRHSCSQPPVFLVEVVPANPEVVTRGNRPLVIVWVVLALLAGGVLGVWFGLLFH